MAPRGATGRAQARGVIQFSRVSIPRAPFQLASVKLVPGRRLILSLPWVVCQRSGVPSRDYPLVGPLPDPTEAPPPSPTPSSVEALLKLRLGFLQSRHAAGAGHRTRC